MVNFRRGYRYMIIYTSNVREISQEYPAAKILLLDESDGYKLVAIEEKEC